MVPLIKIFLAFVTCFSLMSCRGVFSLSDQIETNSSVDNRFIDDGLSLLLTPDTDTIHNESMKHDAVIVADQRKLASESTADEKSSYEADIAYSDASSGLEDKSVEASNNSGEYSQAQGKKNLRKEVSPLNSETENPALPRIREFGLLGDEEHLRLVFGGEAIHEYVQFEVPAGKRLVALFLTSYYGEDDVAFYGIKAGCCDTWTAEPKIIPYLEAWSHIGPTNLGSNILSYSENVQNTNTLPQAVLNTSREYTVLTPGIYVLLVQNANISGARYDFLFKLR